MEDSTTGDNFNPYAVHAQQRDPEWVMAKRAQFQQRNNPAPTACTWCLRTADADDLRMFRCRWCLKDLPACLRCVLIAHLEHPYHRPEEWIDNRWKRVTLHELGYVYQEGHDGTDCPNPEVELETRVTYGAHGREELVVRKCGCAE
ncbi:hypothetical protein B0H14DRAFT_3447441 [Mycena olivaceomarginata]|nr:hypothetical protein B0H14DRAFT_3447441 [Mycena olivaceomarginata]